MATNRKEEAMKNDENLNLVSAEPIEWACDSLRGYVGYSVHIKHVGWPEHVGFPAFTQEQMLEAKRITEACGAAYSWEEFPHLLYSAEDDTWTEAYYDDMSDIADVIEPIFVDGLKLYPLGRYSGWAWGKVEDGYEYDVM